MHQLRGSACNAVACGGKSDQGNSCWQSTGGELTMGHRLLAAIAPSVVVGAREVLQSSSLASIDILSEQVR